MTPPFIIVSYQSEDQAYQNSASFVPKLATKVLSWLDAKPDDHILDIGCGGRNPRLKYTRRKPVY